MSIPSQILPKEPVPVNNAVKNGSVPRERSAPVTAKSVEKNKSSNQNTEIPKGYREKLEKSLKDLNESDETKKTETPVSNHQETEQSPAEQANLEITTEALLPEISIDSETLEIPQANVETIVVDETKDQNNESQSLGKDIATNVQIEQPVLEESDSSVKAKHSEETNLPPGSLQNAFRVKATKENNQPEQLSGEINAAEETKVNIQRPPASLTNALQNQKTSESHSESNHQKPEDSATLENKILNSEVPLEQTLQINNEQTLAADELTGNQVDQTDIKIEAKPEPKVDSNSKLQTQNIDSSQNEIQPELAAKTEPNVDRSSTANNGLATAHQNQNPSSTKNKTAPDLNQTSKAVKATDEVKSESQVKANPDVEKTNFQQPKVRTNEVDSLKPELGLEAKKEIEITQSTSKLSPETNIAPIESRNVDSVFSKQNTDAKIAAERIVEQVAQSVQKAADAGKVFKVRLDPPELGVLQIELSKVNGTIVAKIETETASTQRLVLENIAQLKETLSQQGNPIDKIEVEWNQRGFEEESSNRQSDQTNSDKNQSDKNSGTKSTSSKTENQSEPDHDDQIENKKPTHTRHDEIMTGLDIKV